jgi:hypothetical protein
MNPNSNNALTSVILVTLVFGLFVLSAALRIKHSWNVLQTENKSKWHRTLRQLDLVFSGIFLVASIVFYSFFILNLGR